MSYGFKVKFVEGEAVAYDTYGEPPTDGKLIWVSGHTYQGPGVVYPQETIGVTLVDEYNRQLVSASAISKQ